MKWMLSILVVLFAVSLMAEQQAIQTPSASNMPSVPSHEYSAAPITNGDIQYQIESNFAASASLNNTKLYATVNDDSVTVTGCVDSQDQHDDALRLANSYAGDRTVVDQISIGSVPGW